MNKKIYFASDFHLGINTKLTSEEREKNIVKWLDLIKKDAEAIYLVGDIFDFWFEYRFVIPKGYTRLLGKLSELSDGGIEIHLFTGNHDMWMNDYFEKEIGILMHYNPIQVILQGKKMLIGHGDGLGPNDNGYKLLKKIINHPLSKWMYSIIHPDIGIRIMRKFSYKSRDLGPNNGYLGREKEMLIQYAEKMISDGSQIDYFIFGHRHLPLNVTLSNGHSKYFGLGDWTNYQSYGILQDGHFCIAYFEMPDQTINIDK